MKDIREIASILDETIAKSQQLEERDLLKKRDARRLIRKSLSFDPSKPMEMSGQSSFYNPYQQMEDGSFAPHSASHWSDESKYDLSNDGVRYHEMVRGRDGYRESEAMLLTMKAIIDDTISKGSFPVGTVHDYSGLKFKKVEDGKWVPVHDGKAADHPIEQDRNSQLSRIQEELQARKKGKQPTSFPDRAKQANKKLGDVATREQELSTKDAELSQKEVELRHRELDHREASLKLKETQSSEKEKAKKKEPKKEDPKKEPKKESKPKKEPKNIKPKSPEQMMAFETAKARGYKVPPAWENVWVNPDPNAALQVKGTDSKGRSQSIYSAKHHDLASMKKFNRLKQFGEARKQFISKIEDDLETRDEAKVLYLIDKTGFRVGSDTETGAKVKAYGASTLTSDHVSVNGSKVTFEFIGKKGVNQSQTIDDPKIAAMVKGKKGRLFNTSDSKVRDYLKKVSGKKDFKVKDFRTYVATATALEASSRLPPPSDKPMTAKEKASKIMEVAKEVSRKLGNTPVMARDSYIDPMVFDKYEVA